MNEHGYIKSVHDKLSTDVYRWKIHDSFTGGIPDCWYNGTEGRCMFIEYKYIPSLPKRGSTMIRLLKDHLSVLQGDWLHQKYYEGINVAVIVGSPKGGVIFTDLAWVDDLSTTQFISKCVNTKAVASFIETICRGIPNESCGDEKKYYPQRQNHSQTLAVSL